MAVVLSPLAITAATKLQRSIAAYRKMTPDRRRDVLDAVAATLNRRPDRAAQHDGRPAPIFMGQGGCTLP